MKKELLFLLVSAYIVKLPLASRWHRNVQERLRVKYGRHISFNEVNVNFKGLTVSGLFFFDERKDCTVRIKTFRLYPAIRLRGWAIRDIVIKGLTVEFSPRPVKTAGTSSSASSSAASLDKLHAIYPALHRVFRLFLKHTPEVLSLSDLSFSIRAGENQNDSLHVGNLTVQKNPGDPGSISVDSQGGFSLALGAHSMTLASLQVKLDYNVEGPDKIGFRLSTTTGVIRFRSPFVITDKDLVIDPVTVHMAGTSGTSGLSIEKDSYLNFNKISFTFSYDHWIDRSEHLALNVKLHYCTVSDFLYSFPSFVNAAIYSVSFAGGFGFEAAFKLKASHPFPHQIDFIPVHDLSVIDWGNLDLRVLQGPFTHSICVNGEPARALVLGPESPRFTGNEDISPYFRKAVVFAEDSEFYEHHGVSIDSLGAALRQNIITGKFASGGSTITMQLVKNLFLSQKKNLYRKVEEYFLSWLLTDFAKVDKSRQLEIYLNIIEFGPGIYGITEASEYYFSKQPAALTLSETLVMTYIIPRPKFFHAALLEKTPQLIKNLGTHFEGASRRLLNNRLISLEDFSSMQFEVRFANGLGTLFLRREMDHLHVTLKETYLKALSLWLRRHRGKPCPFVSCTAPLGARQKEGSFARKESERGNVINGSDPSLAFDVVFKDVYGQPRAADNLFVWFAALVREVDTGEKVQWGGDSDEVKDLRHFELLDWAQLNTTEY